MVPAGVTTIQFARDSPGFSTKVHNPGNSSVPSKRDNWSPSLSQRLHSVLEDTDSWSAIIQGKME